MRSVRRSRLQCSVPCMPAESKAGNQVTWNLSLLRGGAAQITPGQDIPYLLTGTSKYSSSFPLAASLTPLM